MNSRDQVIDAFRAIAVVSVVLFHYTDRVPFDALGYESPIASGLWSWGWIGPYWFFIISGFFMTSSAVKAGDGVRFLAKRVSRIYPAYIAAIAIILLIKAMVPPVTFDEWSYSSATPPLPDVIANLFFMTDLRFAYVDGAFWTLVVELKFYAFLAFLLFVVCRKDMNRAIDITALLAGVLGLCWIFVNQPMLWGVDSTPLHIVDVILQKGFIALYLPFFALGMVSARALSNGLRPDGARIGILLALCTAIIVTLSAEKPYVYENTLVTAVVFVVVCLVAAAAVTWERRAAPSPDNWRSWALRPLAHIGAVSYSWYLVHQDIGMTAIYHLNTVLPGWVSLLAAIALTFTLGEILSRTVEWRFRHQLEGALERAANWALSRFQRLRRAP